MLNKSKLIIMISVIAIIVVLSIIFIAGCNKNKVDVLVPVVPGTTLFTMNEWTGLTNSRDINGKLVDQTDVTHVNRLPFRSSETLVYQSVETAIAGAKNYDYNQSDYYKLLTGENNIWKLAVYENIKDATDAGVYGNFFKKDYDMSTAPSYEGDGKVGIYGETAYYGGFKDVALPASWQTQGFDFPIYSNFDYPWNAYKNGNVRLPKAPVNTNPVGFYNYKFDVDANWTDNRNVYISFGGVESCFYLWINGYEVGYNEGSYDTSEFDITAFLNKDGKDNTLSVMVIRWSDGSYFENQDFLRLAGIFRDVYIHSAPAVQIFDYTVVTDLDSSYQNATLDLKIKLLNNTTKTANAKYYVKTQLFDANGIDTINSDFKGELGAELSSGNYGMISMSRLITSPVLWSDENPYLYTLTLSLYDENNKYLGSTAQQLGFRKIEFTATTGNSPNSSYEIVLLNGRQILLKGINRHDNSGEYGKYVSHELYETDVKIMKLLNMNAVRTAHYPNDKYFYYLCDKFGLLMVAEANVETHYRVSANDTDIYFANVISDRIEALVTRERNRTSIIIWSLGNETTPTNLYSTEIQKIRALDPTRMIHFESFGNNGGVDVGSSMYSTVEDMESRGKVTNNMPYLLCEYVHAMGNSIGNLKEYWDVLRYYDNLLGAFIWDFSDQTIYTDIPAGTNDLLGTGYYHAYGGCWGDVINSIDFCQNGILNADRTFQPESYEVKYIYQSVWFDSDYINLMDRKISVYNEFKYTNLSAYNFTYQLLCDGSVIDSGTFNVSCAPGETVSITVPFEFPDNLVADGEYYLNVYASLKEDTLWADAGYVIAYEQLKLPADIEHVGPINLDAISEVNYSENQSEIVLTGDNFTVSFSKEHGNITTYQFNGETLISNGPIPTYTRGKLYNDGNYSWDDVSVAGVNDITITPDVSGKFIIISIELSLDNAHTSTQYMEYIVYGSGEITVTALLDMDSNMGEISRYGNVIELTADYENITYYGAGEWDTFVDRNTGATIGLYSTTVTDSFFPYPNPQDTGNKTNVRYIALTSDIKDAGILVVSDNVMEASAIHYTAQELTDARFTYQLPQVYEYTYLNVNYGSRGTGNGGPDTLPKYRLYNVGSYTYTYTIIPFMKASDNINDMSKTWRDSEKFGETELNNFIASNAIELIQKLKTDTSFLEQAIAAYEQLSDEQKLLVPNYDIVEMLLANIGLNQFITDSSENGFDKQINGAIYQDTTSPLGYAYSANFTVNDRDNIINSVLSDDSQFTVGVWAKLSSFYNQNVVFSKADDQVALKTNGNGHIEFFIYSDTWVAVTINPSDYNISIDTWHYYVAQRTVDGLKLYVDGVLCASLDYTGSISSRSTPLGIGISADNGRKLDGAIAAFHLYDTILTADDIAAQYSYYINNTPIAYTHDNAVIWYDMSQYYFE